jgi:hypothetical protein
MFYKGNSQQIQRLMRMGAGCARENPLEQIFSTEAGEEKRGFPAAPTMSEAERATSETHRLVALDDL